MYLSPKRIEPGRTKWVVCSVCTEAAPRCTVDLMLILGNLIDEDLKYESGFHLMVMLVILIRKWNSRVLLEEWCLFSGWVFKSKPHSKADLLFNLNWLLHLVRLRSSEYHAYSSAAKESGHVRLAAVCSCWI